MLNGVQKPSLLNPKNVAKFVYMYNVVYNLH